MLTNDKILRNLHLGLIWQTSGNFLSNSREKVDLWSLKVNQASPC